MGEENIFPIVKYFEEKCQLWKGYKLSSLGQIAAVKMILLPKLLFLFVNAIKDIPYALLSKLQLIVNNFVWNDKKPKVHFNMIVKSLSDDGLAMPN